MLITVLFIIAKNQKLLKRLSMGEWLSKLWCIIRWNSTQQYKGNGLLIQFRWTSKNYGEF